ncbi:MAG: rod shape-determining protein MreC [Acidimicrobiales bacterium]|nr:rod shape-determining protein MreC [Acidimicrobiales bacterium]
MLSLQRGGRPRFILALLVLTAITLVTLDARGFGPVETARGAALTVLSPFRSALDWTTSPARSAWDGIWNHRELEDENARLRAELAELRGQEFRETTAREVLEQVYTQSDLTFAGDIPNVLGRVVSGPVSNFEETVTIDKGSSDGIEVGMPAVTGAGLVGRVHRVTPDEAVIQLLTDPRMSVGVRLIPSGAPGLVEGQGRGAEPELVVSGSLVLADGAQLQTSGLDRSLYPPDIPVGRVGPLTGEAPDDDETGEGELPELDAVVSQRQAVELAADLDALTFITVLLWSPS